VPNTPIFRDQYQQARRELRRLDFNDQVWVWMGANGKQPLLGSEYLNLCHRKPVTPPFHALPPDLVQVMMASALLTNGAGTNAAQTVAAARNIAVCMFQEIETMMRDGFTKSLTVATIQPIQFQPIWYYATGAEAVRGQAWQGNSLRIRLLQERPRLSCICACS
jgi:hypothetical protein